MHKPRDIQQMPPAHPEVEYYKALAGLAEERAREIRRIAALDRARLEERLLEQEPALKAHAQELERLRSDCEQLRNACERLRANSARARENSHRLRGELAAANAQLKAFRRAQARIAGSRAHRLAEAYVQSAKGRSLLARALRLLRPMGRVVNRARRALS